MNETPSRQSIAKALMDNALANPESEVWYTGEVHPVSALRIECYKLRSAARQLQDHRFDSLRFELRYGKATPNTASLVISHV